MSRQEAQEMRAGEPENGMNADTIMRNLVKAMETWQQLDEELFNVEGMPEEVVPAYEQAKAFLA